MSISNALRNMVSGNGAYLVRVVKVQDVRTALIHLLMGLALSTHYQRRIHVHIVTSEIHGNQSLENNRPTRECGSEKDEQASGCASIGYHVEDGTETCGLLEDAGCVAVQGVEET